MRCIILKDALEQLGCTVSKFNDANKISAKTQKQKEDEDIFSQIDNLNIDEKQALSQEKKPLIIIDAQNVAMRHGKDKLFSSKGIHLAINYWTKNGHQVVCFVPEYILDYQQVADKKKMRDLGLKEVKASQIPDDVGLLNKLLAKDLLVKTPSQDYDDSYCI